MRHLLKVLLVTQSQSQYPIPAPAKSGAGIGTLIEFIDDIKARLRFFVSCARLHLYGGPCGGAVKRAGVDEAGSSNPVRFHHL